MPSMPRTWPSTRRSRLSSWSLVAEYPRVGVSDMPAGYRPGVPTTTPRLPAVWVADAWVGSGRARRDPADLRRPPRRAHAQGPRPPRGRPRRRPPRPAAGARRRTGRLDLGDLHARTRRRRRPPPRAPGGRRLRRAAPAGGPSTLFGGPTLLR